MSKDELQIVEDRNGSYQIQWYISNEDDMGAVLGEDCGCDPQPLLLQMACSLDRGEAASEDAEHFAATVGAASHPLTEMGDGFGFHWPSKSAAQQALRLANLRIKEAKSKIPWPQWARDAVANGWKPPKGWTPA